MSDTSQSQTAKSRQDTPKTAASAKPGWRPAVIAAVGGLLMVGAVGLVLNNADLNAGDAAESGRASRLAEHPCDLACEESLLTNDLTILEASRTIATLYPVARAA
jgi:hypothetical protein